MRRVCFINTAMLAAFSLVLGCGTAAPGLPLVPSVTGKVVLANGKPLPVGKIVLEPTSELRQAVRTAKRFSADVKKDGTFTIAAGDEASPILAGEYKVFVVIGHDPRLKGIKKQVPEKYQSISEDDSDLYVDLAQQSQDVVVKLKSS